MDNLLFLINGIFFGLIIFDYFNRSKISKEIESKRAEVIDIASKIDSKLSAMETKLQRLEFTNKK